MANEIYNSSWWGSGACNDIGWGIVYKAYAGCSVLADRYVTRVEADGGIVESSSCISNLGLDIYNWSYYYRVIDDGGVVESLECTYEAPPSFLLEDGGYLLQEDGFKIIL